MYPATISEYERPATIDAALIALLPDGSRTSACIAGGMSIMQALRSRLVALDRLVDLGHVKELRGVRRTAAGVEIGAMTRYVDLVASVELSGAFGALSDAAAHVGDRQVRNRGTLGGSLCWNYVASCCPVVALALDAQVELAKLGVNGRTERRTLGIDSFLTGPFETARDPGEILTSVVLSAPSASTGSAYRKWALVADALPVVGIAVRLSLGAGGQIADARVARGGLNSGPIRATVAESMLAGIHPDDATALAAAFGAAAKEAATHTDLWASADYRKHLIAEIGPQVTLAAASRAATRKTA